MGAPIFEASLGCDCGQGAGEYYVFHWLVADTAESASAVFLTVVMLASTVAALPAGVLAGPTYLGSSEDQQMLLHFGGCG